MIPKIIHYCWFGKGLMPVSQKDYIKSWKKIMPDYEIKCWDETNFDVTSVPYVKNAYENRKFAFVADYVRLFALKNEGGFYLDTDVEVFKRFDNLCNYSFVSGIEYYPEFEENAHLLDENRLPKEKNKIIPYLGFLTAAIGSEKDNSLINDMMEFYSRLNASDKEWNGIVIDGVIAREAVKYGFIYDDKKQILQHNMVLLPSDIFCCLKDKVNENSILLHNPAQSWKEKSGKQNLYLQLDKLNLLKAYKKISKLKRKILR